MTGSSTNDTWSLSGLSNPNGVITGRETGSIEIVHTLPDNAAKMPRRVFMATNSGTLNFMTNVVTVHTLSTGAPPTIFDDFNRPDNTALGTATSGQAWTSTNVGITGNAAALNGATTGNASIGASPANGSTQFTMAAIDLTGGSFTALVFRRLNAPNYWRLLIQPAFVTLQKVQTNTPSSIGQQPITPAPGDVYLVTYAGAVITVYVNGIQKFQTTDAFAAAGATAGMMFSNSPAARIEDFTVS